MTAALDTASARSAELAAHRERVASVDARTDRVRRALTAGKFILHVVEGGYQIVRWEWCARFATLAEVEALAARIGGGSREQKK
jgi:hypothetical protein